MDNAIVIKGRLTGPRHVELDEPVSQMTERVEVIVHPIESASNGRANAAKVVELLRSLPAGTRTRDDIDRQLREERDDWDRIEGATS